MINICCYCCPFLVVLVGLRTADMILYDVLKIPIQHVSECMGLLKCGDTPH